MKLIVEIPNDKNLVESIEKSVDAEFIKNKDKITVVLESDKISELQGKTNTLLRLLKLNKNVLNFLEGK